MKPEKSKIPTPTQRLAAIAEIIDAVDDRCTAADGPVTRTCDEMTDDEMREIYNLAVQW